MPLSKPAAKARAANKRARGIRRVEIQTRWNTREARRFLHDQRLHIEITPSPASIVACFMQFGKVNMPELLLVLELLWPDPDLSRNVIAYLLRLVELKEMPYREYLQTPEWQDRAARAKELYGGACALNSKHTARDAHHRDYSRLGRETRNDVIPLCGDCHARFHDRAA